MLRTQQIIKVPLQPSGTDIFPQKQRIDKQLQDVKKDVKSILFVADQISAEAIATAYTLLLVFLGRHRRPLYQYIAEKRRPLCTPKPKFIFLDREIKRPKTCQKFT